MTRGARTPDPFERSIESALRPGKFISYGQSFTFERALDELAKQIEPCLVIANIFQAKEDANQALSWVRRGLEISGSHDFAKYDLERRERVLLTELDRPEEALTLAWRDFEASPRTASYGELIRAQQADGTTGI